MIPTTKNDYFLNEILCIPIRISNKGTQPLIFHKENIQLSSENCSCSAIHFCSLIFSLFYC